MTEEGGLKVKQKFSKVVCQISGLTANIEIDGNKMYAGLILIEKLGATQ